MPLYLGQNMVSGVSLGVPGKSAFEAAKEAGYAGTEQEFNHALKDVPGHIANEDNPHGVTAAQVGARPDTWMPSASDIGAYSKTETDTLLQKKVNPNLLDNWYFANPVNQRGQATYTSSENQYTIDRWIKESGTLTVADGCISTDMTDWHGIIQIIEPDLFKALAGKTLTVSILYKNGQLQKVTFTPDSNYTNTDLWMELDSGFGTVIYRWSEGRPNLAYSNSQNGELVAIKLELGDNQTLAHQENGVWVLNEIPDYGEQLRRCQRYFVAIEVLPWNRVGYAALPAESDEFVLSVPLPAVMRATPIVTYTPGPWCTAVGGKIYSYMQVYGPNIGVEANIHVVMSEKNPAGFERMRNNGEETLYLYFDANL